MKTLNDVKEDMSHLYDQVNAGGKDLKEAAELANIAGKYLKAEQLELAREIFMHHSRHRIQAPELNVIAMNEPGKLASDA